MNTLTLSRPRLALVLATAIAATLGGCGPQMETGKGGTIVGGSAGPAGAQGANAQLAKCDAPVATVAVVDNPRGYTYAGKFNLPESPVSLVRLLLQQSGCFRVVDRNLGLAGTRTEFELQNEGIIRNNPTVTKGKGYEAQYTLVPNLVFSEGNAGGGIGGIIALIPGLQQYAGLAEHVKFKEAQITLLLTDNETTEQLAATEGQAKATDIGVGGLVFGKIGGVGGAGWGHTNEGKVVAAAFLDGINKLIPQVRQLQEKALPPPVATKPATAKPLAAPAHNTGNGGAQNAANAVQKATAAAKVPQ